MVSTVTGFRNPLTFPWQTQHLPDQMNLHCHKRIHVVVTNLHPQLSINFCYSVYELIAHLGNMKNDRFFWNTILVLVCHPISFSNILLIHTFLIHEIYQRICEKDEKMMKTEYKESVWFHSQTNRSLSIVLNNSCITLAERKVEPSLIMKWAKTRRNHSYSLEILLFPDLFKRCEVFLT